jgi:uncharacterized membrane protein
MNTNISSDSAVVIYDSHHEAEDAVRKLQQAGFDMKSLSIVGRDYHSEEHVTGFYNTGERKAAWGGMGAFWGGIWGLLFGAAFFWVPGIGPVMMAGPLISALVGGLEGAAVVGGLSALGAALFSLGIPKNQVLRYETEIRAGKYMVVVHGTESEVLRARSVLGAGDTFLATGSSRPVSEPIAAVHA